MNDYLTVYIEKYVVDNKVIMQRFQNMKPCKRQSYNFMYLSTLFFLFFLFLL